MVNPYFWTFNFAYDKYQVRIDGKPTKKHFKHGKCASARMLGVFRNFKKYAEKHGFTKRIDVPDEDDMNYMSGSCRGVAYQNEAGNIMTLNEIGTFSSD